MHWLVYVLMAAFALMVISMVVITIKDKLESRRTQKIFEKIESLSKKQAECYSEVNRALQEKERES